MNYEDKKIKLRRYVIKKNRLKVKCSEADEWNSVDHTMRSGIIKVRRNGNQSGSDVVVEIADTIYQEIETLATEVNELRRDLSNAIKQMPTELYRALLEDMYLSGVSSVLLGEKYKYSKRHLNRLLKYAVEEMDSLTDYFH